MSASDILGLGGAAGVGSAPQDAASKAEMARQQQRLTDMKHRLGGKSNEKELRKACTDFEAMFMGKLWEQMQNSIPKEGYLHSRYEDQYMSMFNQELSKKLANSGGIGIADMMYSQLSTQLKAKEQAHGEPLPLRPLSRKDELPGQPSVGKPVAAETSEAAPQGATPAASASPAYADLAALSQGEAEKQAAGLAARIVAEDSPASNPTTAQTAAQTVAGQGGRPLAQESHRAAGPGRFIPAGQSSEGMALHRNQVHPLKADKALKAEG